MMKPRRDEIVPGSFWGSDVKNRRLDFQKAVFVQILMGKTDDFGPDAKIVEHRRAAEVEIAILKSRVFQSVGFIGDDERSRLRFVDKGQ